MADGGCFASPFLCLLNSLSEWASSHYLASQRDSNHSSKYFIFLGSKESQSTARNCSFKSLALHVSVCVCACMCVCTFSMGRLHIYQGAKR